MLDYSFPEGFIKDMVKKSTTKRVKYWKEPHFLCWGLVWVPESLRDTEITISKPKRYLGQVSNA